MIQCEATTPASTYTDSHRCLKKNGVQKVGKKLLCAHHRTGKARVRP